MSAPRVPFAVPDITDREVDAVAAVIRSGWLTTGEQCNRFEAEFAARVGARHAVALNSCTAAMHLSLDALGVAAGDLVFMSTYTFAATAEVVRYLGATPVLVDIDPRTLNLDPDLLRSEIAHHLSTSDARPRVVMPVHIAGLPCRMDDIWEIAAEHDLAVVDDAAHSFPAAYRGRWIGSAPDGLRATACFSFYATKTITTGEGGMLVTDDAEVAERARSMSLHGLSKQAWSRYSDRGSWSYDIVDAGFKYNMTDMAAAMGRVQLDRADAMWERRIEIARRYSEAFKVNEWVECPADDAESKHAWHLYLLRVASPTHREPLIEALRQNGIGTSVHFIPLHLHSYYVKTFGYGPDDFPHARGQFERVVSLPIYSAMSDEQVEHVIESVTAFFEGETRDGGPTTGRSGSGLA